jgi:hypothetical protein
METLWKSSVMESDYRDKDDVNDKNDRIEIFKRDYGVNEYGITLQISLEDGRFID